MLTITDNSTFTYILDDVVECLEVSQELTQSENQCESWADVILPPPPKSHGLLSVSETMKKGMSYVPAESYLSYIKEYVHVTENIVMYSQSRYLGKLVTYLE